MFKRQTHHKQMGLNSLLMMSKLAKQGQPSKCRSKAVSEAESIKNCTFDQMRPKIQIPYMGSKVAISSHKKGQASDDLNEEQGRQQAQNKFEFAKHLLVGYLGKRENRD